MPQSDCNAYKISVWKVEFEQKKYSAFLKIGSTVFFFDKNTQNIASSMHYCLPNITDNPRTKDVIKNGSYQTKSHIPDKLKNVLNVAVKKQSEKN